MAGAGISSSHAILDLGEDELQFSTHDYKTKVIVEQEEVVRIRVADPDPDSIGSVDPDSESGSGSRRAKMTHKSRKKILSSCFEVLDGLF